ncbi:MAG: glycerophosphodiester phosphodiesterase [Bacteroidales bacterium]|nr:glycerophosphodiester phosphodiesterase [Bacteroidales bacterium]
MKIFVPAVAALLLTLASCSAQNGPAICAHRGFWKCQDVPNEQNSLASLKMSQDYGFWGSEFDVHLTVDGVAVVYHDDIKDGMLIHTTTYEELAQKPLSNGEVLPTLEAYLDQGKLSKRMLVLELKPESSREQADALIDHCIRALKERDLYRPDRVMFISFDLEMCKRLAVEAPEFTNQYLEGNIAPEELHAMGINGIDYHYIAFHKHPDWVERAHKLGMSVNVWTVDTVEEMQYLIDLGVDCITTNEPLKLRDLLNR